MNWYTEKYINSEQKNLKQETGREATVEELQKAAAQYAAKTDKVNKGLDKVSSIANRIKNKVINKQ